MAKSRWVNEPLLHFAIAGAAIFALHDLVAGERSRLVVDDAGQQALDQELLYREALAMRLDEKDPIIRRRLIQKMEFFIEDLAADAEPSDAELDLLAAERDPSIAISFEHVFIDGTKPHPEQRARSLRSKLTLGGSDAELGDPFLRGRRFEKLDRAKLESIFGPSFWAALARIEPHAWMGPIESPYGLHLVRVEARSQLDTTDVDRSRVVARWRRENQRAVRKAYLAELREKYLVDAP